MLIMQSNLLVRDWHLHCTSWTCTPSNNPGSVHTVILSLRWCPGSGSIYYSTGKQRGRESERPSKVMYCLLFLNAALMLGWIQIITIYLISIKITDHSFK